MKHIFIALLLVVSGMYAQEFTPDYLQHHSGYTPVTPNASTFLQYGNTPVNHATGVPQISIPLYTIQEDGVSIPISISYHASGVRVDELASVVGLKWTLNAGGGIFRQVNDKPDESGWLIPERRDFITQDWITQNWLGDIVTQNVMSTSAEIDDYYPDDFNYNFSGYSGAFIFNRNGEVTHEFADHMQISRIQGVGQVMSFLAKDAIGNTFYFGGTNEFNSKNVIVGSGASLNFQRSSEITGWMMDRIVTKNNKQIHFGYTPYEFSYLTTDVSNSISHTEKCKETVYVPPSGGSFNILTGECGCEGATDVLSIPIYQTSVSKTAITTNPRNQLISTIETDNVKVSFNYEEDSKLSDWKKKLTSVAILDKIKNKTKSFSFTYSKFRGDPRLRLDAVQEIGFDGITKPPHQFEYIKGSLPEKGSLSKDLLGYYNGQENQTLVPFSLEAYTVLTPQYRRQLANRETDINYLKRGTLNKIIYPTGGATTFEYDGNHEFTTKVDFPSFSKESQAVFPDTFDVPSSGSSRFIAEFTLENDFIPGEGTVVNIDTYSSACEYDPDNPSIDCSRWNMYQKLSDGSLSDSVFRSPRVIGPTDASITLQKGTYVLELIVENSILVTRPHMGIGVVWEVKDPPSTEPRKVYTGGLQIKEITDKDEDGDIARKTRYSYQGLHQTSYRIDDFIKKYGIKTVFSSDNINLDQRFKKSGHYYDQVTIESVGQDGTLKTIEKYTESFRNKSYEPLMVRREVYQGTSKVKTTAIAYTNTLANTMDFYVLTDKEYCTERNDVTLGGGLSVYLGYGSPEILSYYHRRNQLTKRTEIDYFSKDSEPFNASITQYNYEYDDDMQIIKQGLDGRLYAESEQAILDGNYSVLPDGRYTEIQYTYPKDHQSQNTTLAALHNNHQIALPVSKKVYANGDFIQGQYMDYDTRGNVIATYRHNKGKASHTSAAGHIPSDYELQQEFKLEAGKPVEVQRKDGIPTAILWDITHNYVLAQLVGVTKSELEGVTGTVDLKTTSDIQLNTLYSNLRNAFPQAQITTYIHDPLKGVVQATDTRGYTTSYTYDGLSRLTSIKDQNNSLISENKYHYKNQN